ncbi:hypothetical protein CLU79DRAFT_733941 [Phycomyces nitens]|nr:hypothetical protein CLU79DRAFT_733941 [Phycomyces nitens]
MLIRTVLSFSLAIISVAASSFESTNTNQLFKREDKLPFATLPNANCAAPTVCSNIDQNITCRCNDVLTVCENTSGQFCWGSKTLTSNSCPTVPTSCSSEFNGAANCLCSGNQVLCVDSYNHYCYGTYQSEASGGASVVIAPIPDAPSASSASSASSAAVSASVPVSAAASASVSGAPAGTIKTNPAPSAPAASPSVESAATQLSALKSSVSALLVSLAYFALQ